MNLHTDPKRAKETLHKGKGFRLTKGRSGRIKARFHEEPSDGSRHSRRRV